MAGNGETPKRSRRWFLKGLAGAGALTAAGAGVDWLLPRTLCRPGEWNGSGSDHFDGTRCSACASVTTRSSSCRWD